jgi:outer membrane immunogenic protein
LTRRISFVAIYLVFLASGSAFAADVAVKAQPSLPAGSQGLYNSWTGWYVGGNVGYGWGNPNTDIAGSATSISFPNGNIPFTNPPITFADSATQRLQGVIGGGQIGYNYQVNPRWVVGFETDIQSGQRANNTFTSPFSGSLCGFSLTPTTCLAGATVPFNGVATSSVEAKLEWFGTFRGRVGVLLNDGLLLYGTGGLAGGQISVSGNVNASAAVPAVLASFGPNTSTFAQSKTTIGVAAGAGLEGRLAPWLSPNWTWKLEYLYVDLGSLDTSTPFAAVTSASALTFLGPLAGTMTTHTHFTDNIVRVGLNYQFH